MSEHVSKARSTFERWLSDGESWIGVFENKALDSGSAGTRIAGCFDKDQWEQANLGDRCPDGLTFAHNYGAGWKFLLVAKCTSIDEAMEDMRFEEAA